MRSEASAFLVVQVRTVDLERQPGGSAAAS